MKFPKGTGRWQNIARNDRIYTFCREYWRRVSLLVYLQTLINPKF
jgi:hypothetical protein